MVTGGEEIARFHATIGADTSGLTRGAAQARAEMARLGVSTQTAGTQISSATRAMAAGFGIGFGFAGITAATRALTDSVRATMSYETAFTGVRRTVDATESQFSALDATIRRMATSTIPLGRDELARIATIGGQLNVPINQMETFVDTVARLAVASNGILNPETAAAGLGKLMPQLHIPLEDAAKLASAISKGADVGRGNEAEIIDIALRSAQAQRLVGFTPAQTLALAAAGPSFGNPEEVGTALQQTPMQIAKIVQSGGKELDALALISGRTSDQFRKDWAESSYDAFMRFASGVNRFGQSSFTALDDLGLGGARVGKVLMGIGNDSEEVARLLGHTTEQLRTGAAVMEESERAFGTSQSKLKLFQSQITEVSDAIAGPLIESVVRLGPALSGFLTEHREEIGRVTLSALGGIQSTVEAISRLIGSAPAQYVIDVVSNFDDKTMMLLAAFGGFKVGGGAGAVLALAGASGLNQGAQIANDTKPQDAFEKIQEWARGTQLLPGFRPLSPLASAMDRFGGQSAIDRANQLPEFPGMDELARRRGEDPFAVPLPPGFKPSEPPPELGAAAWEVPRPTAAQAQSAELAAQQARLAAMFGPKGGGPKLSDEQKALRDIEEKHTAELVEAYIKGGDRRVQAVRSEQARLDAAWVGVARDLHEKLGVAVPEEFRGMWEAAQKETEKGKKDTLSGLLGFLAARDTEHGANPLTNKFAVKGPNGETVGGNAPTYVVNGDVNVGLRPDIPGGVDVNAAIAVADRVDFTAVGRQVG